MSAIEFYKEMKTCLSNESDGIIKAFAPLDKSLVLGVGGNEIVF